ncbi:23S rRNA (pseudouridine(1915)-N(3))-methyltransferase RlmH [Nitrospirota bacterium]
MKLRLLWVGKTRETWLLEGIKEYLRKLRPFAQVEVVEVKEDKGDSARGRETERLLRQSGGEFYLFDERGSQMSSEELARLLKDKANVEFVIGGPFGVSDEVREKAKGMIGLSRMVFTHEMARVIVLEQLYRACMINAGRAYHH